MLIFVLQLLHVLTALDRTFVLALTDTVEMDSLALVGCLLSFTHIVPNCIIKPTLVA